MNAVLLWALPNDWTQFDLLAPEIDDQVENEVRQRFKGTTVDGDEVDHLIAVQTQALHEFAQDGVVLLATRPEREAGEDRPPPGLGLTLALANRPTFGPADKSVPSPDRTAAETSGTDPNAGPPPTRSAPIPLVLKDPDMTAFTIEERAEVVVPDADVTLRRFQAQVFVLPKDQAGMAVVTVTTFDPDRESDARQSARDFADTLCFVTVDESSEEER